jgi:ubiquinone/menaquinone biosynthesis C-methylase UbiE
MKTVIKQQFGNIDIYLFDQLLKGKFDNCKTVLDAGCGTGRNIHFFLKNRYDVYGVDENEGVINEVRKLAQQLSPITNIENFKVAPIEELPFDDGFFDVVICSAVLHFARNHQHFDAMLRSIWRILKPQGFLFCRLASNIGIEHSVEDLGDGKFRLPDGTERYLVDEKVLTRYTRMLNGDLFEPLKTTNVQNLRCMTTWCIKKNDSI